MQNPIKKIFKPRLTLVKGTRLTSFLFIATSITIAAGILIAANIYYNIDTGEVVVEHVERVTNVIKAIGGLVAGGDTLTSGYKFEVVGESRLATTTIHSGNVLRLYNPGNTAFVGFVATSSLTEDIVYKWPGKPEGTGYALTSDTAGNLSWTQVGGAGGIGDITTVGDCASGDCFTQTGGSGNNLWFITGGGGRIQLTAASTASNYTITLPAATGYVALGTGTTNYVAYWTGTNTLGAEQYLSTSRGGTGANSSAWTGMVKVQGGTWSAYTGTANYAAMWDSNGQFVTAVQYLPVSAGGTGAGSFTQYGILYGNGTNALGVTGTGNTDQILVSGGGTSAPSWKNIAELITATNGVTTTGTTNLTLKLGGTLTENTTISLADYNMIFNMTGTGNFKVQDAGSDVFVVSNDGKVLFKGTGSDYYPIAQTGKQILREMVPIFGFDLPAKTATTSYVKVSRDIVNYPLNACEAGTSRVHKLVIRYGATATSSWQVATSSGAYTAFQLPPTTATSTGSVYTAATTIPTPSGTCTGWNQGADTDDWWVQTKLDDSGEIMIYQIFLAAYDQIL